MFTFFNFRPDCDKPDKREWDVLGDFHTAHDTGRHDKAQENEANERWQDVHLRLRTADEAMVQGYKEELDTLLVFAGLFSAVLTAFVVESYTSLQPDPSQASVQALYHISLQLHNSSVPALNPPWPSPSFVPAPSDVWINALWFTSLVIALISALLAIFVKQWAREYLSWTTVSPSRDSVALRQYRYEAWTRWSVPRWRDAVAGLLQLGLVLFFVGLVILLWQVNTPVARIVTAVVGLSIGCLLVSIVLPVFFVSCPYRNSASWTLRRTTTFTLDLLRGAALKSQRFQFWSWATHRCSWTHQEKWDIWNQGDRRNLLASNGVFEVLRARPLLATLNSVSPCLYASSFASGTDMQALRAMIEAVLDLEDPKLSFQDPKWHWNSIASQSPVQNDLVWSILRLARQAFLSQKNASVSYAVQLFHFVTAMTKRDSRMTAYHCCTMVQLLSRGVPESLSKAAWHDMTGNPSMRKICDSIFKDDLAEFMTGEQKFLKVMRSLLLNEKPLLRSGRGWLLPPCVVCVAIVTKLHYAQPKAALATNFLDAGLDLLRLIEQYLNSEFKIDSETGGTFGCTWLESLMDHFGALAVLAQRSWDTNDPARQSQQLAQLNVVFSMSCSFTRMFDQGIMTWNYNDLLPRQAPAPNDQLEQSRRWAGQTLVLAAALARLQSPPQGDLLQHLLGSIDRLRTSLPEADWLDAFRRPLRDFLVAFFGSENPHDFGTRVNDETVVPRSLYQYILQHWETAVAQ